jgi:hypothetical protein
MNDSVVRVFMADGDEVGHFVNPVCERESEHHWEISGLFVAPDGQPFERVEFNPQACPYTIDLPVAAGCGHKSLVKGYVQRGRQPVAMTATCKID